MVSISWQEIRARIIANYEFESVVLDGLQRSRVEHSRYGRCNGRFRAVEWDVIHVRNSKQLLDRRVVLRVLRRDLSVRHVVQIRVRPRMRFPNKVLAKFFGFFEKVVFFVSSFFLHGGAVEGEGENEAASGREAGIEAGLPFYGFLEREEVSRGRGEREVKSVRGRNGEGNGAMQGGGGGVKEGGS